MYKLFAVCILFISCALTLAAEPSTTQIHIGPNDFTTKTLGQETVEGHNYLIVQAEARNGRIANRLGYCRIRVWYDMQERVTRKVLLLDHNDVILRTIRFSGYSLTSGVPRPSRMEVTDHATGQTTIFDLDGLREPLNPLTLINNTKRR